MRAPTLLRLIELHGEPAEMAALQSVLEAAPDYFDRTVGLPPGPAEAQSLFTDLPPGRNYDDKVVWGFYSGDEMIGCAEVIRGWNAPHKTIIGLLLLAEPWQRQGLGRAFATLVEQKIAGWPGMTTVRIAVLASNGGALAFWHRLGYAETGESRPPEPPYIATRIVLEKRIAPAALW